jgi:cytochrome c oxidase subunit 2
MAAAAAPLTYLTGQGTKSYPVVYLLWALIAVAVLVVGIVTILLLIGLFRHRGLPRHAPSVPLGRAEGGLKWVYVGTAVSAAALFVTALGTFYVLGAVAGPPDRKALTINVAGHQWWWEVSYDDPDNSRVFTTADEIHIPTGQPVRVKLTSVDVIHSFWVPQLTGKMDTIPGQSNETWLEADKPGRYRGQCTEYCGLQHAHMGFLVIADPPDTFRAWWDNQLKPPPAPASAAEADGQLQFMSHCAACHSVRGTDAGGRLGPDLSHLMSRQTLAAGTLDNTVGALSAWMADPQHIKPGNLMPNLAMSGPQLADIRQYLESLH